MEKVLSSVIIPNWNGAKLLKVCLSSLRHQSFNDFEIIVVDNGSTDESVPFMEQEYPEVKVIRLDKNYGFAKAVNVGINASQGKYIVLLNNDTEVDKRCLEELVRVADKHPEVSFIAAKLLNYFERDKIDSAGDYIDTAGHANNLGMGEQDGPEWNIEGELFLVTGGGSLIKRKAFDQVGLLDEDYFAYFEDVDWCLRAQMQGLKGYFAPLAKIYHIHKASSSRNKPLTEYLQFRNMTQTIIKDFPTGLLLNKFNWLIIILVNLNTVRFMITQGYWKEALKAEGYILIHSPHLLKKRFIVQSTKVVSDKYITSQVRRKKLSFFGLVK